MTQIPLWMSLLTVVLGGGIVSGGITFLLETKRSEKNLLRTKLEELHTAFDKTSRRLDILHMLLDQYAKGESDLKGFLDESASYVDKLSEQTSERVSALCAIYFPELNLCYKSFDKARERFVVIMSDRAALVLRPEGFNMTVADSYVFLQEMDVAMRHAIYRCAVTLNLSWSSRLLRKIPFLGK